MKIGSWTKKLSAALVAGGLMMPVATFAANLGENLIVDGSFEDVLDDSQLFGRKTLLSWRDGIHIGGTYDGTATANAYDIGGPLPGGGDNYFRPAGIFVFDDPDPTVPSQHGTFAGDVSQRIELALGATGQAIADGTALFNVSAFFTEGKFTPRRALGIVELDFRDGGDVSLDSFKLGPNEIIQLDSSVIGYEDGPWLQISDGGVIPAGTDSVFVSVYAVPFSFGPGDYNRSQFVDGSDFLIWQRDEIPQTPEGCLECAGLAGPEDPPNGSLAEWEANYGTFQEGGMRQNPVSPWIFPHEEKNAYIDLVDFQVTSTAIATTAHVPEPASWTLLVTMAMGVTSWRRRSSSTG